MPYRSNLCRLARFVLLLVCLCLFQSVLCSLVAVSQVEQCVQVAGEDPELLNKDGKACGKKMVVALTVSGNEVSSYPCSILSNTIMAFNCCGH